MINIKQVRLTSCRCSEPRLALRDPNGWLKMINSAPEFTYLCLKIYHILKFFKVTNLIHKFSVAFDQTL